MGPMHCMLGIGFIILGLFLFGFGIHEIEYKKYQDKVDAIWAKPIQQDTK